MPQYLMYRGEKYRNVSGLKIDVRTLGNKREKDEAYRFLIESGDLKKVQQRKKAVPKTASSRKCLVWEKADGTIDTKPGFSMKKIKSQRMKDVRAGKKKK